MSKRVVIHLRPDVPVECDFLDAYAAMPRRAEWVRRTLLRGFVEEQRRRSNSDDNPYEAAAMLEAALGLAPGTGMNNADLNGEDGS